LWGPRVTISVKEIFGLEKLEFREPRKDLAIVMMCMFFWIECGQMVKDMESTKEESLSTRWMGIRWMVLIMSRERVKIVGR